MTDPYDQLLELADMHGVRISPLFRVFVNNCTPSESAFDWRVCATTLQGDPTEPVHSVHKDLAEALQECKKANILFAGMDCGSLSFRGIPPGFPELIMRPLLERVDQVLGKHNNKPKRSA